MSIACNINALVGLTLRRIDRSPDVLTFESTNGRLFRMSHIQDCCESVYIEDICGELDWLIGTPIVVAREDTNSGDCAHEGSYTWTFYTLATINGTVTIRWYGSSNGYYSEAVDFVETT